MKRGAFDGAQRIRRVETQLNLRVERAEEGVEADGERERRREGERGEWGWRGFMGRREIERRRREKSEVLVDGVGVRKGFVAALLAMTGSGRSEALACGV